MVKNNNNTRKVSEEFVIKVFDKVREVNQELTEDVKTLRNAVIGFGDAFNKRYEGQPRPTEAHALLNTWGDKFEIRHKATKEKLEYLEGIVTSSKEMLKDHCDHAESEFCSIEEELKEDEGLLTKIFDGVTKLRNRVTLMIVAVSIAFSMVTVTYLFVRNSIDTTIRKKIERVEIQNQTELQKQLEDIKKSLEQHMREERK